MNRYELRHDLRQMIQQAGGVPRASRAVGVSGNHMYNVLRGLTRPSAALMERIADYLDRPVEECFPDATFNVREQDRATR